jgi:aldose 1-epimerase
LRSYTVDGRELLDGYAADEMASSARGQPLIPWPNRVRDGRYRWGGAEHQLPLNEPAKGNAIHGFSRYHSWTCVTHTSTRVESAGRSTHGPAIHSRWPSRSPTGLRRSG